MNNALRVDNNSQYAPHNRVDWTQEMEDALLQSVRHSGKTDEVIAQELSDATGLNVTRSAVINKRHAMGALKNAPRGTAKSAKITRNIIKSNDNNKPKYQRTINIVVDGMSLSDKVGIVLAMEKSGWSMISLDNKVCKCGTNNI